MRGRARGSDPSTSQEAAFCDFTEAGVVVLRYCLACRQEGVNWMEAWLGTKIARQTISPRWAELLKQGVIERRKGPNGKWITRPGESRRRQLVHWITPSGEKWLDTEDSVIS